MDSDPPPPSDLLRPGAARARSMYTPGRSSLPPAQARDLERGGLAVIAVIAAVGGVAAGCEPMSWVPGDVVLAGALAAGLSLAATRARRWTWLLLSGAVSLGATDAFTLACAAAAVALAVVGTALLSRRNRFVGAAVGGLSAQVLLRLPEYRMTGVNALVAAVLTGIVFVSASRAVSSAQRRRLRRVSLVAVAVVCAFGVSFAVAAWSVRGQAAVAQREARAGLASMEAGNGAEAADHFSRARTAFAEVRNAMSGPLGRSGRAVPVLAQQQRALAAMAASGEDLSETAGKAAASVRVDDLAVDGGHVDLAVLGEMQEPSRRVVRSLDRAHAQLEVVRSPWLVAPVDHALEDFTQRVDRARDQADVAAQGIETAPWLLGADGPRNYLVLLSTPAEARFLGGFVGAYAELGVDRGTVRLQRSGSILELSNRPDADRRSLSGLDEYLARYGRYRPARYLQNLTASPDFPTVAEAARQLYPQAGGVEVDGVAYIDPAGMAALLRLTGPIKVDGLPEPLTADNAEQFLLVEQYIRFPAPDARSDVLARVTKATFEALTTRALPSPRTIGDTLGPAIGADHLRFTVFDRGADAFLRRIDLVRSFRVENSWDIWSFRTANAGASKIDTYLEQSMRYRVEYDPGTGSVDSTLDVALRNTAPASGLPDYVLGNQPAAGLPAAPNGTNICDFSFWTGLDLVGASVDGVPTPVQAQREAGGNVYSGRVLIPPGGESRVVFTLAGRVRPDRYELRVEPQASAHPAAITAEVRGGKGALPRNPTTSSAPDIVTARLTEENQHHVTVSFSP